MDIGYFKDRSKTECLAVIQLLIKTEEYDRSARLITALRLLIGTISVADVYYDREVPCVKRAIEIVREREKAEGGST